MTNLWKVSSQVLREKKVSEEVNKDLEYYMNLNLILKKNRMNILKRVPIWILTVILIIILK